MRAGGGWARTQARSRLAYFGPKIGQVEVTVLTDRQDLAGHTLVGPAILEEYDTTIVVPPGCRASLDELGNLLIDMEE